MLTRPELDVLYRMLSIGAGEIARAGSLYTNVGSISTPIAAFKEALREQKLSKRTPDDVLEQSRVFSEAVQEFAQGFLRQDMDAQKGSIARERDSDVARQNVLAGVFKLYQAVHGYRVASGAMPMGQQRAYREKVRRIADTLHQKMKSEDVPGGRDVLYMNIPGGTTLGRLLDFHRAPATCNIASADEDLLLLKKMLEQGKSEIQKSVSRYIRKGRADELTSATDSFIKVLTRNLQGEPTPAKAARDCSVVLSGAVERFARHVLQQDMQLQRDGVVENDLTRQRRLAGICKIFQAALGYQAASGALCNMAEYNYFGKVRRVADSVLLHLKKNGVEDWVPVLEEIPDGSLLANRPRFPKLPPRAARQNNFHVRSSPPPQPIHSPGLFGRTDSQQPRSIYNPGGSQAAFGNQPNLGNPGHFGNQPTFSAPPNPYPGALHHESPYVAPPSPQIDQSLRWLLVNSGAFSRSSPPPQPFHFDPFGATEPQQPPAIDNQGHFGTHQSSAQSLDQYMPGPGLIPPVTQSRAGHQRTQTLLQSGSQWAADAKEYWPGTQPNILAPQATNAPDRSSPKLKFR